MDLPQWPGPATFKVTPGLKSHRERLQNEASERLETALSDVPTGQKLIDISVYVHGGDSLCKGPVPIWMREEARHHRDGPKQVVTQELDDTILAHFMGNETVLEKEDSPYKRQTIEKRHLT